MASPRQWTGRSVQEMCRVHNEETNNDINLALLQIRSAPVRPGLQSPTTLFFKRLLRGLILRGMRTAAKYDYNKDNDKTINHSKIN